MNTKDKVIKAIQELPPDDSIEDAMEKLYLRGFELFREIIT